MARLDPAESCQSSGHRLVKRQLRLQRGGSRSRVGGFHTQPQFRPTGEPGRGGWCAPLAADGTEGAGDDAYSVDQHPAKENSEKPRVAAQTTSLMELHRRGLKKELAILT